MRATAPDFQPQHEEHQAAPAKSHPRQSAPGAKREGPERLLPRGLLYRAFCTDSDRLQDLALEHFLLERD